MRVHLNAHRFQGRDAKDRFRVVGPEDHRGTDDFAHELDLSSGNVQLHLRTVGRLIGTLRPRLQTNGPKMIAGHKAIYRSGIHKEEPFPRVIRPSRIPNRHCNVRCSHVFDLVFPVLPKCAATLRLVYPTGRDARKESGRPEQDEYLARQRTLIGAQPRKGRGMTFVDRQESAKKSV